MISSILSALRANLDSMNLAAERVSQPIDERLVDDMTAMMLAEHSVEASISALRTLNQTESHIIDLLA